MIWRNVFGANHGVDVLPVLSSSVKNNLEKTIEFQIISLLFQLCHYVTADDILFMWWPYSQWLHVISLIHGSTQFLKHTTICHVGRWNLFFIFELGIYFVFFCISMCYVRLYETVQARFINKCWRRGVFLFGFFNFINLYGRFKKKYMLHQIIITIIINLLYTVMYLYKSFKLALRINPMSMT